MRVYTFTLPKFVSGMVRKCADLFKKDDSPKVTKTAKASKGKSKRRKKQDKTPG